MDVVLDFSCFDGASKVPYGVLHTISTAAAVTIGGEQAIGRVFVTLKSQISISTEVKKLATFIYNSVYKYFFTKKSKGTCICEGWFYPIK